MKFFIVLLMLQSVFCLPLTAQNAQEKAANDFNGSGLHSDTHFLQNSNKENGQDFPDAGVTEIPSFTKITSGEIVTDSYLTQGCAWVDFDNDGDMDLFAANNNNTNNSLYSNNGDGTFTKVTAGIIVTDGGSTSQASWGDYNNDGNIDLFITNKEAPISQDNSLYLNNGSGNFTKITTGSIVNDGGYSFGSAWADVNNDGYLDMFVVNEVPTENNFLY